jgi:2-polyprenyl-3-methyl-5-hydroxy-6-metoxy-1,4-benzoquinol methylase
MKIDYLQRDSNISSIVKQKIDQHVFLKVIKKIAKNSTKQLNYLEFGPGRGEKFDSLENFFGPFQKVTFIDCDEKILDFLTNKYPGRNINFINCSADSPIEDKVDYDLILSSHVIEHLENPREHLKNILNLLADDGTAFLASPNLSSCDATKLGKSWRGYADPTHINMMGVEEIKELCLSAGLSVKQYGTSLYPKSFKEILSFFLDWEFTFRQSGRGDSCSFILKR